MLVGFGLYILALVTTVVALGILAVRYFDPVARALGQLRDDDERDEGLEEHSEQE
jgi:hypothetical protein